MKSVLISIRPKWCELIANGQKTVEVRKTKPKLEPPFKVYIYCTGGPPYLNSHNGYCYLEKRDVLGYRGTGLYCRLNNGVIGEFVCDKIVKFENSIYDEALPETVARSCVPMYDLLVYLGKQDYGFGWHISNLVIYDQPKELSDFYKYSNCNTAYKGVEDYEVYQPMNRPPQSWCYVEEGGE